MGQALAERMIENGIFVIAVGRRKDRLEALLAKYGTDKIAIEPFDVSDVEAIPTWAKEYVDPFCLYKHGQYGGTFSIHEARSGSLAKRFAN